MSPKRARSGLLARLVRPLRRLVGAERSAAPAEEAHVAAAEDEDLLVDEEFRLTIDTLRQDKDGRFQTKLQIISLVEFREAVGERWYRVADKVMMIAEGVINVHIGAGNLFTRQGQDFFILVFRGCSQLEGRRRALAIAQDLGTRLLGDQFIGLDRPLALAAELTLAEAVNDDGAFNMAAIHTAIGEMRAFLAEEGGEAPRLRPSLRPGAPAGEADGLRRSLMPSPPPPEDAGLRHSLLPSRHPPPAKDVRPPAPMPIAPSAIERPDGSGPDPQWQPIRRRKRHYRYGEDHGGQLAEPEPPLPPLPRRPTPALLEDAPPLPADAALSLLWRPTWTATAEAVALYKAQVQRTDRAGQPALEGSRAYPADGAGAATLDHAVIAGAASELAAAAGTEAGRSALILPLHWASVTSAQRMSLTAPLSGGNWTGRLVAELFGQPRDVAPRALEEAARAIRSLGREAVLRVRFAALGAAMAADCGFTAIGIDLADLAPTERTDDQHLLAELMRLRDAAARARLGCYVWGVRRRRVVVGTVQGGFAMVNGPALMNDLERPGGVLPVPKSRFRLPS